MIPEVGGVQNERGEVWKAEVHVPACTRASSWIDWYLDPGHMRRCWVAAASGCTVVPEAVIVFLWSNV